METVVRGMHLEYPPKPERLNAYGNGWWGGGGEPVAGSGQEESGVGTWGTRWSPRALQRV